MLKKYGRYLVLIFVSAVIIIVFIVVLTYVISSTYKSDPQSLNIYVAVGTLVLAFSTAVLALVSWWNIRENKEKENRDRKERLLGEIIQWAEISAQSAIYRQTKEKHELYKAILNYKNCLAKSEYIKVIANIQFNILTDTIVKIIQRLDHLMQGTKLYYEFHTDENHKLVLQQENNLTESVKELFKEAAKLKSELK